MCVCVCVCVVQLKGDVSTRLLDVKSEVSRYVCHLLFNIHILVSLSSIYFLSPFFM